MLSRMVWMRLFSGLSRIEGGTLTGRIRYCGLMLAYEEGHRKRDSRCICGRTIRFRIPRVVNSFL